MVGKAYACSSSAVVSQSVALNEWMDALVMMLHQSVAYPVSAHELGIPGHDMDMDGCRCLESLAQSQSSRPSFNSMYPHSCTSTGTCTHFAPDAHIVVSCWRRNSLPFVYFYLSVDVTRHPLTLSALLQPNGRRATAVRACLCLLGVEGRMLELSWRGRNAPQPPQPKAPQNTTQLPPRPVQSFV